MSMLADRHLEMIDRDRKRSTSKEAASHGSRSSDTKSKIIELKRIGSINDLRPFARPLFKDAPSEL